MTAPFLSPEIPEELVDLGVILGVLSPPNGQPASINPAWFAAPDQHLKGILDDPERRQTLVDLATDLLGTATEHLDLPDIDEDTETWIPIAEVGSGPTSGGVFAVIGTGGPEPVISLGGRVAVQHDGLTASMTTRVPLISAGPGGIVLLPGSAEGVVEVAVNVTVDGLGVPGIVELEGVSFAASLPTDGTDPSLTIVLKALRLPSDASPSDLPLGDVLDELGPTAFEVMLGLIRSQPDLPDEAEDLLALIGFDPASPIPELPLIDLIENGLPALREWVAQVVATALDDWMGRLASFLGVGAVTGSGTVPDPYRICFDDGPVHACLTLATTVDSRTGATTVVPGASLTVDAPATTSVGGGVEGTIEFARLLLDHGLTVVSGPALRVVGQLGTGSLVDTTIDTFAVEVEALRAGLSFVAGGQLMPLVEAVDVTIAGSQYPILDLTSVEAVTGVASDVLGDIVGELLDTLGIATNPQARALAALAGLVAPDGAPAGWPETVDLSSLFSDPLAAIGCYHALVLADPGRWQHVATHLAQLVSPGAAISGSGTVEDPWVATLFDNRADPDPVTGAVDLVAWTTGSGAGPFLHVGMETHPVFDVAGLEADLSYRAELLRVELPTPPDCVDPVGLVWAPTHRLGLTLNEPTIVLGPVTFRADRLALGLTLDRERGLVPDLTVVGAGLAIDGSDLALPDLDLASLPDFADLPWPAIQLLVGDWLGDLGLAPLDHWLALLGWRPGDALPFQLPQLPDLDLDLPDLPSLDLEQLLTDPLAALVDWLGSLFAGSGSSLELPSFLLAIGRFASATAGEIEERVTLRGTGTYADPWAASIDGSPLEALVWLDPDGPDLGGASGIVEHLLGDTAPTLEEALTLLDRAAGFIPQLADALGDTGPLGPGIDALRERLEGDGLVRAIDQHPPVWNRIDLSPAAHFSEPPRFTMPPGTGAVQKKRRIFVTPASLTGVADWPDHDIATTVDLTEPGIRPESIDLSHITAGDTWIVLLPSRAEAVVPDDPTITGEQQLAARLRRAVDHIHAMVGGSLALIGHSTAGQICRLVAADPAADTHIGHVITVGTPHGGASFEFLDRLDSGETLRTLQRLRELLDDAAASSPDVAPVVDLLDSLSSTLDPYRPGEEGVLEFIPFPAADFAVPAVYPDVDAGTTPHAVVGSVAGPDLDAALSAFIRRVIEAGIALLPAGGAVTHLGLGMRATLAEPDPAPGVVSVGATARVDLHRIRLASGTSERTIPFVSADLVIRRNGGWLVGGPDPAHPAGAPRDPRARWLEASLTADPTALADALLTITLHDAALFGTARPIWIIDDEHSLDGITLIPEARILLGETFSAIGTLVADSPVERLVELLAELGLAEVTDGRPGLVSDAIERLLADPGGEIATRLASRATEVEETLSGFVLLTRTGPGMTLALAPWASLLIPETDSPVSVELTGLPLAGTLLVTGQVTLDEGGTVGLAVDVRSNQPPGLLGAISLGVTASGPEGVTATINGNNTGLLPTLVDSPLAVVPVPSDLAELAALSGRALGGDLARRVVEFIRTQVASARRVALDMALDSIGALAGGGQVRNLAGLFTDPGDWLAAPDALGLPDSLPGTTAGVAKLSATEARTLLLAGRDLLGLPDTGPTLPLPWGMTVAIAGSAGEVTFQLGWNPPAVAGAVDLQGAFDLTVSPGFDVATSLTSSIEVSGTGLDHARLEVAAGDTVAVTIAVQPTGGAETVITLLPQVSGLSALGAGGAATIQALLPLVLDAVASRADIGPALASLGSDLGLRDSTGFLADQLIQLAASPATELATRLHAGAVAVLADLASLLAEVADGVSAAGTRLTVTPASGLSLALDVPDLSSLSLCIDLVDQRPIPELRLDVSICVDHTGLNSLDISTEVTDPALLSAAGVSLLPRVAFLAGAAAGVGGDRAEAGLWLDSPGADPRQGVFVLIPFGSEATPVCRTVTGGTAADSTDMSACLTAIVEEWVTPLAAELVLAVERVADLLEQDLTHLSSTLGELLEAADILTRGSSWHLADGVVDDLLPRVVALAAAILNDPFTVPLGPIQLEPLVANDGGRTSFGLKLGAGSDLVLNPGGDIRVSVTQPAAETGGVSLVLFTTAADITDPQFVPSLVITDIGIEVASGSGGKLVDLVAGVDAIELLGNLTISPAGVEAGGLEVGFVNLTLPIGAAGGGNPVASKILSAQNEASDSGDTEELAPALNPRLELTLAPTFDLEFRLDAGEGPWWIPIQQAFGPLYVEQMGGMVENDDGGDLAAVVLLLDGGVSLAGLAVGVDDLSLRIPWETGWDIDEWAIDLAGLAIGYSGSGVTLAGGLRKSVTDGETEYVGLVQVDAMGFGISAFGAYGEFPDPAAPGTTYTSMFVFAALSAPLGGPPFFFVTGIGGGVGLNRELVLPPEVVDIPGFPLVAAMDSSSGFAADPMGILETVSTSFPGRRGSFWFAAGVRFTSFVLLETVAVLAVEIGDDLEVALLGLSQAVLPDPDFPIANVELALIARFSTAEGVLWVQAQLTDNSWLLNEDCRLTGGFAFVVWFHRDEFVFTIGGYHPRFAAPDYYPVVPRLGFNWNVSGALVIKGENYFALTSSCVMAGARIEASYTTSVVWASLSAGIDGLVSWDPFFYDVSAYVRVSAGIEIRVCFFVCGTVRMSFSMGARLRIWGPELKGEATLELGPIEVTVRFGADPRPEKLQLEWSAFVARYLVQEDPANESMSMTVTTGQLVPDPGLEGDPDDGSAARPWRVVPEFSMRFETRAASQTVEFPGGSNSIPGTIDLAPVGVATVDSTFSVTIRDEGNDEVTNGLDLGTWIISKLPDAPWHHVSREERVPEAGTIEALTGVVVRAGLTITGGEILVDLDLVDQSDPDHPLPFLAEQAARPDLMVHVERSIDFLDAQPVATEAVLVKASTAIDGLAAASVRTFRADRVSPPRLAPLTEGMVDPVKPAVATKPIDPPAVPPGPDTSTVAPIVMGVLRDRLAAGARAPSSTSVRAAEDIPRVTAPTLTDVRLPGGAIPRAHLKATADALTTRRGTAFPRNHMPATRTAARGREFRGGYRATPATARHLTTIGRRLLNGGHTLAPGDALLLRLPNARRDSQPNRPHLAVDGDQMTRVTVLNRVGAPISDQVLAEGTVTLPVGAERVAVAGMGAIAGNTPGMAGWHAEMTVQQVSSNTYLAARALIRSAAPRTRRGGSPVTVANLTARDATWGRSVTTHLPGNTTAVVVGLSPTEPVTDPRDAFASIRLGLLGADRTTHPDGSRSDPQVVVTGDQIYGVFAVAPNNEGGQWVTVSIESNARWNVIAVGGAPGRPSSLIDDLVHGDPAALFGTGADPTGSSRVRFVAAVQPSPERQPQ